MGSPTTPSLLIRAVGEEGGRWVTSVVEERWRITLDVDDRVWGGAGREELADVERALSGLRPIRRRPRVTSCRRIMLRSNLTILIFCFNVFKTTTTGLLMFTEDVVLFCWIFMMMMMTNGNGILVRFGARCDLSQTCRNSWSAAKQEACRSTDKKLGLTRELNKYIYKHIIITLHFYRILCRVMSSE